MNTTSQNPNKNTKWNKMVKKATIREVLTFIHPAKCPPKIQNKRFCKELIFHSKCFTSFKFDSKTKKLDVDSKIKNCSSLHQRDYQVLKSASFRTLTGLRIEFDDEVFDFLKFLSTCEHLKSLYTLQFRGNELGDFLIEHVSKSPILKNLTKLVLRENKISKDGIAKLSKCQNFSNLTSLDLFGNKFEKEGVECLSSCKNLRKLTSLNLGYNLIGDEGVRNLISSNNLKNLINLDLSWNNNLGPDAINYLSKADNLSNLISLDLSLNPIGDKGIENFTKCNKLSQLKFLSLGKTNIEMESIKLLAKCKFLEELETLILSYNDLRVKGIKLIYLCKNLPNLKHLGLSQTWAISEQAYYQKKSFRGINGLIALTKSANLKNLSSLFIKDNDLSDKDVDVILTSNHFSNLTCLDLQQIHLIPFGCKIFLISFKSI